MVSFANDNNRDIGEPFFRIQSQSFSSYSCMEQRSLKSAAVQGPETNFRLSFSSRLCPSQFHVGKALLVFCGLQVNWAKASLAPSPIFYTTSHDLQGRSREVPIREKRSRSKITQGEIKQK